MRMKDGRYFVEEWMDTQLKPHTFTIYFTHKRESGKNAHPQTHQDSNKSKVFSELPKFKIQNPLEFTFPILNTLAQFLEYRAWIIYNKWETKES